MMLLIFRVVCSKGVSPPNDDSAGGGAGGGGGDGGASGGAGMLRWVPVCVWRLAAAAAAAAVDTVVHTVSQYTTPHRRMKIRCQQ